MSELTKGKWECQDSKDSYLIHIGPVDKMGIMEFCVTSVHDEDHAQLIAAAPDMLEALECCLPVLKALCADGYIGNYKQTQKVIKAIAKAKGE